MLLETERLWLRPFRADDRAALQRWSTDRRFQRHLSSGAKTPAEIDAFLDRHLATRSHAGSNRFLVALERKDRSGCIGAIRLHLRDEVNRSADLGFGLDPEVQGQGLMTEAAGAILVHGFEHLGLHRIRATVDPANRPSWRLLERLGMRREGRLRGHRATAAGWRDAFLYAKLASDA